MVTLLAGCLAAGCSSEVGGGGNVDARAGDGGSTSDAGPQPGSAPEVYPTDRTLSPITPHVAANLRAIAARSTMQEDVFAKIGASATVSINFMHCFAGPEVDLDGRDELAATVAHFAAGDAAGTDPYQRDSLSATVGWSAGMAIAGDPSPLEQELAAISPRFAVIMYGTNDIQLMNPYSYGANLLAIADQLMAAGVIPLFTTVMPRDDSAAADAVVPLYNMVVRAVAQARQVPLIDFHRELAPLPDHGLGADDLHPSVYRNPSALPCDFTAAGLTAGYNLRNLITIQTLDRARRVVIDGEDPPDAPLRTITGAGSLADPVAIDALPFSDVRDTRTAIDDAIDLYDGCAASQDESGREHYYRFEVTAPRRVRAVVVDHGGADIDVHLLGGTTGADCIARDHRQVIADLEPGTYYFVLDSFASGGVAQEGEYLFIVMEEP